MDKRQLTSEKIQIKNYIFGLIVLSVIFILILFFAIVGLNCKSRPENNPYAWSFWGGSIYPDEKNYHFCASMFGYPPGGVSIIFFLGLSFLLILSLCFALISLKKYLKAIKRKTK
jgi:hypothetical protein